RIAVEPAVSMLLAADHPPRLTHPRERLIHDTGHSSIEESRLPVSPVKMRFAQARTAAARSASSLRRCIHRRRSNGDSQGFALAVELRYSIPSERSFASTITSTPAPASTQSTEVSRSPHQTTRVPLTSSCITSIEAKCGLPPAPCG